MRRALIALAFVAWLLVGVVLFESNIYASLTWIVVTVCAAPFVVRWLIVNVTRVARDEWRRDEEPRP